MHACLFFVEACDTYGVFILFFLLLSAAGYYRNTIFKVFTRLTGKDDSFNRLNEAKTS